MIQTKGWNFSNAITYGRAGYVATGRGYQVDTVSVPELYSKYAQFHICLAYPYPQPYPYPYPYP